ncbi:MAG: molybdopterin-guanine dinucleotide biosynthesis protein B, partial [candidate division Zixibacteria bacterium]
IVGAKNSGKTTLIEAMVPIFIAKGLKVATIKHTGHDHTFDTRGKDTFRHRQAGAGLTMAISQSDMAVFAKPEEQNLLIANEIIARHFDLCLIEGDKQSSRPKALLTANIEQLKPPSPENVIVSYGSTRFSTSLQHFQLNDVAGLTSFFIKEYLTLVKE